ncbi:MAG: hypothetical protein GX387_02770 [Clostridium sp.]|nr:hypothetical protein [Clostridium sp.]
MVIAYDKDTASNTVGKVMNITLQHINNMVKYWQKMFDEGEFMMKKIMAVI